MTRINVVPPASLTDRHLLAEYRELPRVFGLVAKAVARGETPETVGAPPRYVLGAGHVKFFYARLEWLRRRFEALVRELRRRGFAPTFASVPAFVAAIPREWHGDYRPTRAAIGIARERIAARLAEARRRKSMPKPVGARSKAKELV